MDSATSLAARFTPLSMPITRGCARSLASPFSSCEAAVHLQILDQILDVATAP